jgi:hypothetical protein
MFVRLKQKDVGCHIGPHFMGAFGYADDAALVAPSCGALQKMINTCSEFAKEYNVKFNPRKSMCLKSGSHRTEHDTVCINGQAIEWVTSARHLGNVLNIHLTPHDDCAAKLSAFYGSVNKLIGLYGGLEGPVMCKLFNSFCCSFHGSQLWPINSQPFLNVCTQWNKAVRRVLKLPNKTHTWLLGPLLGTQHISHQLKCRFLKFFHSMSTCTNNLVNMLHRISVNTCTTMIGQNFSALRYEFRIDHVFKPSVNISRMLSTLAIRNAVNAPVTAFAEELFLILFSNDIELHLFETHELLTIFHYICCE